MELQVVELESMTLFDRGGDIIIACCCCCCCSGGGGGGGEGDF